VDFEVLALPHATDAARRARRHVTELLRESCPGRVIETVVLLTSELVSNAIRHGAPPVQLRIDLTHHVVRVEIYDSDSAPPVLRNAERADLGGRGLAIVDLMATRWGTQQVPDGKFVWFELAT
jgi:anti-sigma regulatory factor (Ser/Thr protein kinase)